MGRIAGLDAGSVSVKLAVLDEAGAIVDASYVRHKGRPLECALALLGPALDRHPGLSLAVTGGAGRLIARALGAPHVNELRALAEGSAALLPGVCTIFEMGGEDSKLLILSGRQIRDFSLNAVCAAGTGSFLDQQAERMGLTIEAFAELALAAKRPARIAGRCSVFAKSDMIHLQQIATPMGDIVAGLCLAVARNFRGSIVRGRPIATPAAFLGGVALNRGVARAFCEAFGLPGLLIPDRPAHVAAAGAALVAGNEGSLAAPDLTGLHRATQDPPPAEAAAPRLLCPGDGFAERHLDEPSEPVPAPRLPAGQGPCEAYLGIDVGSISTNLAVLDCEGRLLAKRYLRTASKPIEVVRQGLAEIRDELGGMIRVCGVGTTGSGRYMIADLVAADVVKNEITAQATAAVFFDPSVDTIFEIGGQDSKFIALDDGRITDFAMNKACAAGTGSFLEEQAERLGVAIEHEFESLALEAQAPCPLGERCTVFMENSLLSRLTRGAGKDDILAGLAYSIVQNYINRVVAGRRIGRRIFFQGGTAFNRSVVAAFEKHLGRPVFVPPHHDVTGAIGMALIARDHCRATGEPSSFRGFGLAETAFQVDSFECPGCENACEINKVSLAGVKKPLFYGGRCERYEIRRSKHTLPDLFAFREQALLAAHEGYAAAAKRPAPRGQVGLPMALLMHDLLPWFATLLWELGFEPRPSPRTSKRITALGASAVLAETCHPVKAAFGHVRALLKDGATRLFIPSMVNSAAPGERSSLACPITQSFPYQVESWLRSTGQGGIEVLAPAIERQLGPRALAREIARALGVGSGEVRRAMVVADAAQADFVSLLQARGRQFLEDLDGRAVVLLGRSYNAFDPGLNLDIPRKLASLDVPSMPMDFLPLPGTPEPGFWPKMYWRSGQRMLAAARLVRGDERLFAVHVGSFSCGPDSFIEKFLAEDLSGKPYLAMEIDEHSADAGAITRLEAFLDSVAATRAADQAPVSPRRPFVRRKTGLAGRIIYGPPMSDHCLGLAAAFRACGVESQILPGTDAESIALARRHTSGKECYPCAVTTGDLLKKALAPDFEPERSAFFMPGGTGPCRFGQYSAFQRLVLDRVGLPQVPVYAPMQDMTLYEDLAEAGKDFARRSFEAVMAFDLLIKCLHRVRPFEREQGAADALYAAMCAELESRIAEPRADILPTLKRIRQAFEAVARDDDPARPVIGVVGEIFVRSNRFSNEDLVRRIETLGGEARLAGVEEWVIYISQLSRIDARRSRNLRRIVGIELQDREQRKIARRFESAFEGFLEALHEPRAAALMALAAPYLRGTVRGEAVLSLGKSIDLARPGHGRPVAGIISAIPFGCMPGSIAAALLREVSNALDVPILTLAFDGSPHVTGELALETFMEQARERVRGR